MGDENPLEIALAKAFVHLSDAMDELSPCTDPTSCVAEGRLQVAEWALKEVYNLLGFGYVEAARLRERLNDWRTLHDSFDEACAAAKAKAAELNDRTNHVDE